MDNYFKDIALREVGKIHEFSEQILKASFPLCITENPDLLAQSINKNAYCIKTISEQLSGMLRR